MPTEVKAPALGESVTEIYVGKWYKSPGDPVVKDESLVELESDKATVDLPAPDDGTLSQILKETGSTVEVGETLALVEKNDGKQPIETATKSEHPPPSKAEVSPAVDGMEESDAAIDNIMAYSDIAGPIAMADKVDTRLQPQQPRAQPDESTTITESARQEKPGQPEVRPTKRIESNRLVERVPMSPLRRRISLRLVEAQHKSALLTTYNEVDMSAVKQLRAEAGESFERKHGVRLGFMSFFVKAAIAALEQYPQLNAVIEETEIVYQRFYDIGIAVSTEKGLVVPVLRDAEQMSFADIERRIEEFATRARDGKLRVEDLQGGTFTISNGGVFGSLLSTPIINPPQSGVLGMHAIEDRPIVRGGEIVIRPMMYLALTYDHRIVDGREAVIFLKHIKQAIEAPARLLLDV